MNKLTNNQNIDNFKSNSFDWRLVQADMKDKLGSEVYESWLKNINLKKFSFKFFVVENTPLGSVTPNP